MDDLVEQVHDHEQQKAARSESKRKKAELNAKAGKEWRASVMTGVVSRDTLTDASTYEGASARVKGGQR
jgi:hypothetical protein